MGGVHFYESFNVFLTFNRIDLTNTIPFSQNEQFEAFILLKKLFSFCYFWIVSGNIFINFIFHYPLSSQKPVLQSWFFCSLIGEFEVNSKGYKNCINLIFIHFPRKVIYMITYGILIQQNLQTHFLMHVQTTILCLGFCNCTVLLQEIAKNSI